MRINKNEKCQILAHLISFFQFVYYKVSFASSFLLSEFIHLLWFLCLNLAFFRVHAIYLATLNQHFIWHYLTMRMLSLLFIHSFFHEVEEEKCTKQLISSYGFACLSCYVCHHVSAWAKCFSETVKEEFEITKTSLYG